MSSSNPQVKFRLSASELTAVEAVLPAGVSVAAFAKAVLLERLPRSVLARPRARNEVALERQRKLNKVRER